MSSGIFDIVTVAEIPHLATFSQLFHEGPSILISTTGRQFATEFSMTACCDTCGLDNWKNVPSASDATSDQLLTDVAAYWRRHNPWLHCTFSLSLRHWRWHWSRDMSQTEVVDMLRLLQRKEVSEMREFVDHSDISADDLYQNTTIKSVLKCRP